MADKTSEKGFDHPKHVRKDKHRLQRGNETSCGTFSFSKADRLLKRSEFICLSKFGRRSHYEFFIANYLPGRSGRTRLGISVPKKVGTAVSRNRLKRLIREYFRLHRHTVVGIWDLHLIAKKGSAGLHTADVFSSLRRIFAHIPKQT